MQKVGEDDITLLLRAGRRLAHWILLGALTLGAAGFFWVRERPQMFRAQAVVQVEGQIGAAATSQSLLEVSNDGTTRAWLMRGEPASAASLETSVRALGTLSVDDLLALAPEELDLEGLDGTLERLFLEKPTSETQIELRDEILAAYDASIKVSNDANSFILRISAEADEPETARRRANAHTQAYIEENRARKQEMAARIEHSISAELSVLNQDVERLELDIANLYAETPHDLRAGRDVAESLLTALQANIIDEEARLFEEKLELADLERRDPRDVAADLPSMTATLAELTRLQREIAERQQVAASEGLNRIAERKDSLAQEIAANVKQVATRLRQRIAQIEERISALRARADQISDDMKTEAQSYIALKNLNEHLSATTTRRNELLIQQAQVASLAGLISPDIVWIERAASPDSPISPNPELAGLAGAAVGGLIILIFGLWRERMGASKDAEPQPQLTDHEDRPDAPARAAQVIGVLPDCIAPENDAGNSRFLASVAEIQWRIDALFGDKASRRLLILIDGSGPAAHRFIDALATGFAATGVPTRLITDRKEASRSKTPLLKVVSDTAARPKIPSLQASRTLEMFELRLKDLKEDDLEYDVFIIVTTKVNVKSAEQRWLQLKPQKRPGGIVQILPTAEVREATTENKIEWAD